MSGFIPIISWGLTIKKLLFIFLLPLPFLYAGDRDKKTDEPVVYETDVTFQDFAWGTSMDDVIKKMGRPVSREEVNGLTSLVWENVEINGYKTYMLAYFSKSGLQGGTYYFLTRDMDDLVRCYREQQNELLERYGPTNLQKILLGRFDADSLLDPVTKELRPYESTWNLPGGYVHLKVNARQGDPVTLWFCSPELSRQISGEAKPATAKR